MFITNFKKLLFTIFLFIFVIFYVLFSKQNVATISKTVNLFFTTVLPSLYIFIFFTEIMYNLDLTKKISSTFLIIISRIFRISKTSSIISIIGFLFGYPNSAKYISYYYKRNEVSFYDIKKLVLFTNNANISYIILGIGINVYSNMRIGIILALSHYISSVTIGICGRFFYSKKIIQHNINFSNNICANFSKFDEIKKSIKNTNITLMFIFSYMIIFSFIPALIINAFSFLKLSGTFKAMFIGIFEITSGISEISKLVLSTNIKICLTSFILSFSSFMVIFQIYTYLSSCKIKLKNIILYKFVHGIISTLLTYCILSVF